MAMPMGGPYGLKLLCKGRARKRDKLSLQDLGPVCLVEGGVTHLAPGVGRCRVESAQLSMRTHAAMVHCVAERLNPGLSAENPASSARADCVVAVVYHCCSVMYQSGIGFLARDSLKTFMRLYFFGRWWCI